MAVQSHLGPGRAATLRSHGQIRLRQDLEILLHDNGQGRSWCPSLLEGDRNNVQEVRINDGRGARSSWRHLPPLRRPDDGLDGFHIKNNVLQGGVRIGCSRFDRRISRSGVGQSRSFG
jgi:hypothetical protein